MLNLQNSDIDFLVMFGMLAAGLVAGVALAGLAYWAVTGRNPFEDAPQMTPKDDARDYLREIAKRRKARGRA